MTITIDDIKTLKFGDKVRINPCFLPKELVRNSILKFLLWAGFRIQILMY